MGNKSVLLYLAVLAASVASDPIPRPWAPERTAAPVLRRQDVPEDCTFLEAAYSPEETCEDIATRWGISVEVFISWNPSLGAGCSGFDVNQEYCVERNWGNPLPTSTSSTRSTTTRSSASSGPTNSFPSPVTDGIIQTCNAFYKVASGDTCDGIVSRYGTFTLAQFLAWNPAIGSGCRNLWAETYYCVGIPGTPTARPSSTTRTTTTGVPKPSPTQPGLISSCVRFYKAISGDTCDSIVAKHGTFTFAQFVAWNPAVGSECRSLWAETYYCIGIPGTPTTTVRTSTTTRGNGIATPSPTQRLIVSNCDRFYLVKTGENCQQVAARHGITTKQLNVWNPSVGETCTGLWANAYACVRTIGYVYPTTTSCATSGKTWGDNKPSALNSVVSWCDGNSNTDGNGNYSPGQQKYGCYNAPFGNNKIEFRLRNDFGVSQSLSVAKCQQLAKLPVDGCARGGTGGLESWFISAVVVEGRC
jgi:LysM repeat protein